MAVRKNLMVRVGADMSGLVSAFQKAGGSTKGFKEQVTMSMEEAERSVQSLAKHVVQDGYTDSGIVALQDQLRMLKADAKDMEDLGFGWGYAAYEDVQRQIQSMSAELNDYIASFKEASAAGDDLGDGLQNASGGAKSLGVQLQEAKTELKALELAGLGAGDWQWDDQYQKVSRLKYEVKAYKKHLEGTADAPRGIRAGLNAVAAAGSKVVSSAKRIHSAFQSAVNTVKKIGSAIGGFIGKVGSLGGRILGIGRSAKSSESMTNRLLRSIRNIGIAGLGMKLLHGIFGRLKSIIGEYLSQNEAMNAQVQQLKSSMGEALAPAIHAVVGALSAVMPYIIGVSNAIGNLVANLFGNGWSTVASGANAAASATSGAAAAQEKYNRTLAGFDEITKLGNSGGGGGGGGSGDVTSAPITGVVPGWMKDIATQLKEAIAQGDFTGVGEILADKLGVAVDWASAKINSGDTREKISGWITNFTDTVNGFFGRLSFSDGTTDSIATKIGTLIGDGVTLALSSLQQVFEQIDFGNIGKSLAQSINGAAVAMNKSDVNFGSTIASIIQAGIDGASGFVENLDWTAVGTTLGRNINSFFAGIDWGQAGETLSSGIKGALGTITTAIQEVDWAAIGNDIGEFFGNIDWAGVASALGEAIGAALGGIGTLILTAISGSISEASDFFAEKIQEHGGNVALGILDGIAEAFLSLGTWINENIFTPLVDGFKSTFNIHSPSKDEEILGIGKNIALGILNGLAEPFAAPVKWVKDNILTPLKNAFTSGENSGTELPFTAKMTSWQDALQDKKVSFQAKLTSWRDALQDKKVSFQAKLTSWRDALQDKKLSFQAKLTSWRDALQDKKVSFQAKLTSWKDCLTNKWLDFKANVKKGWVGSLASKLGISTVDSKLNFKLPKVVVKWSYGTGIWSAFKWPSGFDLKWYAKGGILDGAQIFGRMGNTLLGGGEAGKEAVLPLERNTWWMDTIARKTAALVGSSGGSQRPLIVQVMLDGRVVGETAVEYINGEARTTGVNPLSAYI